jgi:hypothetical protein
LTLRRYEKLSDNYPLYEFESMSICKFAMLFDDGDDDENGGQRMIINHKIYQDKRLFNGAMDAIT